MIANKVDDLITSLEQASKSLSEWCKNSLLKNNAGRCHLLVSTNDRVSMNINGFKIYKSNTENRLVVELDKKLAFDDYISDICKKQVEKYLLWPELHHTWELRRNAY